MNSAPNIYATAFGEQSHVTRRADSKSDIANSIRTLFAAENVETNRPAVDAGLAVLDVGGDFADGVIAYEGRWLGADTFASFDKKAVEKLAGLGEKARLLWGG
jgi:predicted nucleic-acid-binding protein